MATVLRYVNTNSTAGGDGTTNNTTGVSRAYADLAEWEAAEQADLVAAGDIAEVICSGGADSSAVDISGWVTSVTSYILIHATTDKHGGVFDSGKYYFEGDSVSTRFTIAQGYVHIEDLQFTRPTPAASGVTRPVISWSSSVGTQYVRRSIFKFDSNDIAGTVGAFAFNSSTPDYVITDNIFDNRLAGGGTNDICITGAGASADVLIYNNTFINWSLAINSRANYIVKNNIFQDCTDDITGTLNANNNYNLTDNTSIAGANSVTSSTLTFADKAAFNFALASGDTDAIGAGIGPSTDGNVSLTDVIGTSRSGATTDIGAFVFVGGGGGVTVTATLGAINYSSQDATISLTGSVDIATTLGTISYTSQDASISITGSEDIAAGIGYIDYTSQAATIQLTGAIDVAPTLGSINYTSRNTTISITGSEDVSATLGAISYSSNDTTVSLTSQIDINATLGAINYTSNDVAVTLSGTAEISATLGAIVYNSYSVSVSIGEGQVIGNATTSFASDIYSSGFKPNTITVNFK